MEIKYEIDRDFRSITPCPNLKERFFVSGNCCERCFWFEKEDYEHQIIHCSYTKEKHWKKDRKREREIIENLPRFKHRKLKTILTFKGDDFNEAYRYFCGFSKENHFGIYIGDTINILKETRLDIFDKAVTAFETIYTKPCSIRLYLFW